MFALTEVVTLSKMRKPGCTLLLFEGLLYLAAFPYSSAQSNDTTIFPDDPDLKPSEERNVCSTPECIHTASRVLSYMKAGLDPCDNFYKFACGKFIDTYRIHADDDPIGQTSLIENNVLPQLMNYLQNETLPSSPRYFRLIKTFFSSCTHYHSKENSFNIILEIINKTNGWPRLKNDSWEDKSFQWEKFGSQTEYMNSLHDGFIYYTTEEYIDMIVQAEVTSHEIAQPRKIVTSQELYNNLLTFGELFGAEKNDVENSLKQMLEVHNKLQELQIHNPFDVEDLGPIEEMTVKELVQKYPNILWKEFFDTRVKQKKINDDDLIQVHRTSYFEKLNKLIPTISKRDQANYLMWRGIYQHLKTYFDALHTANYPFQTCYESTLNNFNAALKFFYVKNTFNNDSFPKYVDEMFQNIHEEYRGILKNSSWLDNETKLKAIEKLESIIVETPSKYLSYDEAIDEYYKSLEITPGDYLLSLSNFTEFEKKSKPRPGNKRSWKHLPVETFVNCFYRKEENLLFLSPTIFQRVFYDKKRPKYMNYGSVGSIIGHEMSHAFDSNGRNYDKKGNPVNWWTAEANATFLHKVQCIINKHNDYRFEEIGLDLNGNRTQTEDISDYVGIEVTYSAYEKYMETHGLEPLLPGVNYTQRQLFWLSYAQTWCTASTTEHLKHFAENDEHSISEFRVNGPLSNSLKFAEDFHCASNAKMNSPDKCTIW